MGRNPTGSESLVSKGIHSLEWNTCLIIFFRMVGGYVNFESVLGDLLLDLERSHGFLSQGSKCAQLNSVVLPLDDQNVLSHLELVVGQFAVAKSLSLCLFVV